MTAMGLLQLKQNNLDDVKVSFSVHGTLYRILKQMGKPLLLVLFLKAYRKSSNERPWGYLIFSIRGGGAFIQKIQV